MSDIFLAVVVAASGLTVALLFAGGLQLEADTSAGLLASGLTSSTTLAAGQETIRAGIISPPEGWTADQMLSNVATGYGITYIFGLTGLIAIIKLMPGVLNIDLQAETKKIEQACTGDEPIPVAAVTPASRITEGPATVLSSSELRSRFWDGFSVVHLERDGKQVRLRSDEHLKPDDKITVIGDLRFFTPDIQSMADEIIGPFYLRHS